VAASRRHVLTTDSTLATQQRARESLLANSITTKLLTLRT
jgi:hypothetical protein